MPWDNSPEKRRRDQAIYGDPEYKANRAVVLRRAGGRCERCGRRDRRLQVDHVTAIATGGADHSLGNLQALCSGPGSCHASKTARDANAARHGSSADPDFVTPRTQW